MKHFSAPSIAGILFALATSVLATTVQPVTTSPAACKPTSLGNGNFETGKLAPWTQANEYLNGLPAVTITKGYKSNYAVNLSLIYQPSDKTKNEAPLIYFGQDVNSCGVPQTVSLYYNVQPNPAHNTSFLLQVYDSGTHHVYVEKYIYYNSTSTVDSLGNPYGKWHLFGPFNFIPGKNFLPFALILDGSYGKAKGTSSILVDDVVLETTPP